MQVLWHGVSFTAGVVAVAAVVFAVEIAERWCDAWRARRRQARRRKAGDVWREGGCTFLKLEDDPVQKPARPTWNDPLVGGADATPKSMAECAPRRVVTRRTDAPYGRVGKRGVVGFVREIEKSNEESGDE